MRLSLRNKYLSQARYNRYLTASGNNTNKAKKLYLANVRLAQAFHPIISQFEVILRNCIDHQLSNYFDDSDWIMTQKTGFMSDPSLGRRPYLKEQVLESERRMGRLRVRVSSGKIIADQTFGFWIAFFSRPHYRLLSGRPIQIFPDKPTTVNRAQIHHKLKMIRDFRNRANHCEPLCFNGISIDCDEAILIRKFIFDLAEWINPNLIPFISKLDNTYNKINYIMSLKHPT